jgi:hypothetical protein
MRARRGNGAFRSIVERTGTLPPLAGAALAFASYFLFHWWVSAVPAAIRPDIRAGDVAVAAMLRAFAEWAQYGVPAIFGLGAVASLVRALTRRRTDLPAEAEAAPQQDAQHEPRREHDVYRVWAGDWDEAPLQPVRVDASCWSLELLRAIEWKRFEALCAAYFEALGFVARTGERGPDGGIDIRLFAQGSDKPGVLVQCKAWSTYDIGVKAIRELHGVMAAEGVAEGAFVTTGRYTFAAQDFARGKEIALIDGPDLVAKIDALRDDRRAALLAVATAGDFTRPTCPSCGVKMVRRIARASGDPFWGCHNFPGCRTALRIAAEAPA